MYYGNQLHDNVEMQLVLNATNTAVKIFYDDTLNDCRDYLQSNCCNKKTTSYGSG
ncbi:MAG TPA: hypothetical protein PL045_01520 [Chitinophagaceae bacterium]|nr:hypothetical protein [Chitinophagaceae bacterium]